MRQSVVDETIELERWHNLCACVHATYFCNNGYINCSVVRLFELYRLDAAFFETVYFLLYWRNKSYISVTTTNNKKAVLSQR